MPQRVVKGGIDHGFQAPKLTQISPDCREDKGPNTGFGNPALKPEANNASEIGAGWAAAHCVCRRCCSTTASAT